MEELQLFMKNIADELTRLRQKFLFVIENPVPEVYFHEISELW